MNDSLNDLQKTTETEFPIMSDLSLVQIKVAVSADRNCVRAYKPEITSSNFNTLTLTVKTTEPDNLLFYMGSSSSVSHYAPVNFLCFLIGLWGSVTD